MHDATVLVWLDVETTGLNPWDGESLLEVACLVTDTDLNLLDEQGLSFTVLVGSPAEAVLVRERTNDYVTAMHDATGLWERIGDPDKATPLAQIDEALTEYVKRFAPARRTARLAGNSVRLDMNFIEVNLPGLYDHLHYRVLDVTGLAAAARWWGGMNPIKKERAHTALADIRESLAEARQVKQFWTERRKPAAPKGRQARRERAAALSAHRTTPTAH